MTGVMVCVRCRPFNSREKARKAKLVVRMVDKQTIMTDPSNGNEKPYTFDFSFWSHNNKDSHFVNNEDVYQSVGKAVLKAAWDGFNSSLFAYGQTGAGKSYSMVGYGEDIGIIPKACAEIFNRIKEQTTKENSFKVESSMLEIYNEQVRDLFNPKGNKPGGLKVREHPKTGVFVDGLCSLPVHSYAEISDLMDKGSNARTVASTNMNATSSRAHTMFVITLTQTTITEHEGKETKADKSSKISLIDLAGSEKVGDTGATGDRLKEGCAINQSLTALGNVISALVKKANAKGRKKKGIFIPYRGSILTWLMKDSLGGNAKTIMIAAISPASICFEDSLSTLKYANRAKQIKNKAVVNEDKQTRMIRELKSEVMQLRKALKAAGGSVGAIGEDSEAEAKHKKELEELKKQLQASQSIIQNFSKSDAEKEAEKKVIGANTAQMLADAGVGLDEESLLAGDDPFLTNMHPDEMMDGRIIFKIKEGEMKIGRRTKSNKPQIPLGGVTIQLEHAILKRNGSDVQLLPQPNAKTYVNGILIAKATDLKHMDRMLLGQHVYKFQNPVQRRDMEDKELEELEESVDYVMAQQEFADKQGMSSIVSGSGGDKEFDKKMALMKKKFDQEKKLQQEQLQREKEEMERKRKEIMASFENLKNEASHSQNKAKVEILEKKLAQRQRAAELEFKKQQEQLEMKKKKIAEEMKKQEDLANKLQLKKKREEEQRKELEQSLLELIPMVLEANSISGELDKQVRFRTKLIAYLKDDGTGKQEPHTELGIQVIDVKTNKKMMWNYDKFSTRYYLMQEMYQNWQYAADNDEEFTVEKEKDPFYDPESGEAQLIGISMLYLKSLSHRIDLSIWTPIINNKGEKQGEVNVSVIPCNDSGKETITDFVQDPYTLTESTEPFIFKVKVKGARGIPIDRCKETYLRYKFTYLEKDFQKTKVDSRKSTFPAYDYEKQYSIPKVKKEFIDYLRNSAIKFEVFGKENSDISVVGRPNTSRPTTAMRFEEQQKNEMLSQMAALSTDNSGQMDRRRMQRQDSMSIMAQQMMMARNRTGNDNPIQRKQTLVRINKDGDISIPKLGAPVDGSEACSVM